MLKKYIIIHLFENHVSLYFSVFFKEVRKIVIRNNNSRIKYIFLFLERMIKYQITSTAQQLSSRSKGTKLCALNCLIMYSEFQTLIMSFKLMLRL